MALDIKYRIKSIIVNEIDFVTKNVKGGFKLSFSGGLKMYDLGGLRTDRC